MAKIKIKFGENELEIDSRDFYLDNQTASQIIDSLTKSMQENKLKILLEDRSIDHYENNSTINYESLNSLDDIEVYEPEFTEPVPISIGELPDKLKLLESKSFFDTPRTVTETVEQLREMGWSASLLDVSKILAKMAFKGEILKNSREHRNYYFIKNSLLTN